LSESTSTIDACLRGAAERLRRVSPTPRLDAEILLARVLNRPRSYLYTWPERALDAPTSARFEGLLRRREAGEPVAHLSGWREFWSLDLRVDSTTLIPRPETELLVTLALACLQQTPGPVVDLGTGSGAVALAIAHERPDLAVVATDIEPAALALAADNARRLGLGNIRYRQGDWYQALAAGEDRFQVLVSNPPYLAEEDSHLRQGDVRFEPRRALVAGEDGLAAIRSIIAGAGAHLDAGGWLLLEHGHDQAGQVTGLLRAHGFEAVDDHRDGEGRPRVAVGRWPHGTWSIPRGGSVADPQATLSRVLKIRSETSSMGPTPLTVRRLPLAL